MMKTKCISLVIVFLLVCSVGKTLAFQKKIMYNWHQTDSSFTLKKGNNIIWQYNFNTKHGKTFFHPINVSKTTLTCVSPKDHLWHLGQWFSWKYIDSVNYWEYNNNNYESDGITEIKNIALKKNPDFSADISLIIEYNPVDGDPCLSEKRKIHVSPPDENGNIYFDYTFEFVALKEKVTLDRTPILSEQDGKSWGGYSGLSIRFNQDFTKSYFISPGQNTENQHGEKHNWLYMGFTSLTGKKIGACINVHPQTINKNWAWYIFNTPEEPFYYISPAYLFYKKYELKKDEILNLKYRIEAISGNVSEKDLQKKYQLYIKQNP